MCFRAKSQSSNEVCKSRQFSMFFTKSKATGILPFLMFRTQVSKFIIHTHVQKLKLMNKNDEMKVYIHMKYVNTGIANKNMQHKLFEII